ncbi:RHS repeat-associated core domain-containing protein [Dyella sp. 2HG41-7]|uniref:RHS repeat-associated core domain-containing protein n=1 Tax=Dyella sp. 2HG41-7 TaxID=2883239 RepID=UPI001F292B33|nr:RHS repeat-associated core domain-containing protein [Dyella sp. 2HG41-7]
MKKIISPLEIVLPRRNCERVSEQSFAAQSKKARGITKRFNGKLIIGLVALVMIAGINNQLVSVAHADDKAPTGDDSGNGSGGGGGGGGGGGADPSQAAQGQAVQVTANRAPDIVIDFGATDVTGMAPQTPQSAIGPSIQLSKSPGSVTTLSAVNVNAKISKTTTDCTEGDPIDLGTQAKVASAVDFQMPGEMGLKFVRYYNSNAQNTTLWGTSTRVGAWSTSYDYVLTGDLRQSSNCNFSAVNSVCPMVLVHPDGRIVEFAPGTENADGSASFVQLNNGVSTMTRNSDGSYVIHDENSNILTFSSAQFHNSFTITSIKDLAGIGWSFSYPDANDMIVTHTSGQTVKLNWTDTYIGYSDLVQPMVRSLTVTDPSGKMYSYNTSIPAGTIGAVISNRYLVGELDSVTYPYYSGTQASVVSYKYIDDTSGVYGKYQYALTEVDYNGVAHDTTSYNSLGQTTQTQNSDGTNKVTVTYASNSTGVAATVTNPLGHVSVYQFDGNSNIVSITGQAAAQCQASFSSQTYDGNGNVKSQTDANGNVTNFTYAANGELSQKVEGANSSYARTTNFAWDPTPGTDRLASVTVVGVLQTKFFYTPQGRIASVTQTNLTSAGVSNQSRTTSYGYTLYPNGMVQSVKVTPPSASDTAIYNYDTLGNVVSIVNGLGQSVTYNTHDGLGRVTRMTDANGVISDFTYNSLEWPLTHTVRASSNGSPSSGDAVTTLAYSDFPFSVVTSVTDPDGVATQYSYDASQRMDQVTDALGNYIKYTLNAAGDRTERTIYNSSNQASSYAFAQYNVLSEQTNRSNASGLQIAGYSYDPEGNLTDAYDANGVDTHFTYDVLNRLHSTIRYYGGSDPATANATTTYSYDALDHLVSVVDPGGLATTYTTDGFGQTWAVNSPDSGQTNYAFDSAGRLTGKTDARGYVTNYSYDSIDRLTGIQYPAHPALNVTYTYDQSAPIGICPTNFNVGHLTGMTDASGSSAWCYTNQGYIRVEQKVINGTTYISGFVKTLGGRMKYVQYPSALELTYGFDADGRVNSINYQQNTPSGNGYAIVGSVMPLISGVNYLPFGPMENYTWAQTGSPTEYLGYDGNYILTDIVSTPLNLHYGRDGNGNVTGELPSHGANPPNETYHYDALHRLYEVDGAGGALEESFTYNVSGDRLSKTVGSSPAAVYGYNANSHYLTSVGGALRTVDSAGNTTTMTDPNGDIIGLDYDDRNVVDAVTTSAGTIANYQYNGFGQRVWRTITSPSAGQAAYVFDPEGTGEIFGEYFASDHREFVYLNGMPVVAAVDASPTTTATIRDLYTDQNGTIRAVTDTQGNQIYAWPWLNNAFGEAPATGSSPFYNRFPGQNYDVETGLFYNGARYYDPSTGRYIQSDPLGLSGGQSSTYAYVDGNSLNYIDMLGLCQNSKCTAARAFVAALGQQLSSAGKKTTWAGVGIVAGAGVAGLLAPEGAPAEISAAEVGAGFIRVGGYVSLAGAALTGYAKGGFTSAGRAAFMSKSPDVLGSFLLKHAFGGAPSSTIDAANSILGEIPDALEQEEEACGVN